MYFWLLLQNTHVIYDRFCAPGSHIVIILLQFKITVFYFNIFTIFYLLLYSAAITPVVSVKFFRNHSNMPNLVFKKQNFCIIIKIENYCDV